MKFRKLIASLIVLIMTAVFFVGCGLFTKNPEKQLALVVARVVEEHNGVTHTEEITRRDLIIYYYNNDGSNWVNQGTPLEEVLKAFLNQLVSRKVFFIEGKKALGVDTSADTNGYKTKYAGHKDSEYLSAEELRDVELTVLYSNQERINGYKNDILSEWYPMPESDVKKEETSYNPAPNAKPEADRKPPKPPKPWELPEEVFADDPDKDAKRQELDDEIAVEALLRLRRQIDMENFSDDDFQKKQIESAIEQRIIENYRDEIYKQIRDGIAGAATVQALEDLFNDLRKAQIEQFGLDPAAFFSKATNPSDSDFLLFYPNFGASFQYISVKNLLVKFDDKIDTRLNKLKETIWSDDPWYIAKRLELIAQLSAKDLRDPYDIEWDWSGNSYDQTFGLDGEGEKDGSFDIDVFMAFVLSELGYADINYVPSPAEYAAAVEKFVELIFAFGEDGGMFNSKFDYIVAPVPDENGREAYAIEFATAAREFTEIGQIKYAVTDFGLHVLLCTNIIDVSEANLTLEEIDAGGWLEKFDYNDILNKNYDSITYRFFNFIFESKKEERIYDLQKTINDEYHDAGKIKKYYKNIEDLWKN